MSAADVNARALYGETLGPMEGVLHVVATAGEHVIRIGPWAPKSEADFFALELARARVEAILITGAILRAEPELRYALSPDLAAWRDALGLRQPPWLLVLSRGDVPLDHPALVPGPVRPMIFTGERAADELRSRAEVEVVGAPDPSARAALAYLRERRGCRSVSVEAGPTTAVPLYDPPCAIDELALSVYEGELDPRARGGRFIDPSALAGFVRVSATRAGEWRFERWVSPSRRGTAAGSR